MADPSVLLSEVLQKEWPKDTDCSSGTVVRSPFTAQIHAELAVWGRCVVLGPPRSAKTTLVRYAGWEILSRRVPSAKQVRYLDMAKVNPEDDLSGLLPLDGSWLCVIDNWHVAGGRRSEYLQQIQTKWKTASLMFVVTIFESADATTFEELLAPGQEPLDTGPIVPEIAEGMFELASRSKSGGVRAADSLLLLPSEHRKVRSNLRVLYWRLEAWQRVRIDLSEVGTKHIKAEVTRRLAVPAGVHRSTLERIAAVAQWELPFRRRPGNAVPPGIAELERNGIVVSVQDGAAWGMDATDAYLVLDAATSDWSLASRDLLREYLLTVPDETSSVLRALLSKSAPDVLTEWLADWLKDVRLQLQLARAITRYMQDGNLSIAASILNAIIRGQPSAGAAPGASLELVGLFSLDSVPAAASAARDVSLQPLCWFLRNLRKAGLNVFHNAFIAEIAVTAELRHKVSASSSATIQRWLLREVAHWSPDEAEQLRHKVRLLRLPPKFAGTVKQLSAATAETGSSRVRAMKLLGEIDEQYLEDTIRADAQPTRRLQLLLNAAAWLSPVDASRIATAAAAVWSNLRRTGPANELGRLLVNLFLANPSAARQMAEHMLDERVSSLIPADDAEGLGRMLTGLEKAAPGGIRDWAEAEAEYFGQVLGRISPAGADDLLFALAAFAPDVLKETLASCPPPTIDRIKSECPGYGPLPRMGALGRAGDVWLEWRLQDIEVHPICATAPGLASWSLLACHAGVPLEEQAVLEGLLTTPGLSSYVLLVLARYTDAPSAETLTRVLQEILTAARNPRHRNLQRLVLACSSSSEMTLGREAVSNFLDETARAVHAGTHDGLFTCEEQDAETMRLVLNESHPFVRTTLAEVGRVRRPLDRGLVTLTEWHSAVGDDVHQSRLRAWIVELLNLREVVWTADLTDRAHIHFAASTANAESP
jgi:hypothetical protein